MSMHEFHFANQDSYNSSSRVHTCIASNGVGAVATI